MTNSIIVGALKNCEDRKNIEDVFSRFNIEESAYTRRIDLLLQTMNNPKMFYSNGTPTDEQKYELIMQTFLAMNWKYADMIINGVKK